MLSWLKSNKSFRKKHYPIDPVEQTRDAQAQPSYWPVGSVRETATLPLGVRARRIDMHRMRGFPIVDSVQGQVSFCNDGNNWSEMTLCFLSRSETNV